MKKLKLLLPVGLLGLSIAVAAPFAVSCSNIQRYVEPIPESVIRNDTEFWNAVETQTTSYVNENYGNTTIRGIWPLNTKTYGQAKFSKGLWANIDDGSNAYYYLFRRGYSNEFTSWIDYVNNYFDKVVEYRAQGTVYTLTMKSEIEIKAYVCGRGVDNENDIDDCANPIKAPKITLTCWGPK